MKAWIGRSLLIFIIFACIGFIWGKSKEVGVETVYLDLKPTYRNHIIQNLKKEKEMGNLETNFDINTLEKNHQTLGKENHSKKNKNTIKPVEDKLVSPSAPIKSEVDIKLDTLEKSSKLFSREKELPGNINISEKNTLTSQAKESFLDQVKRFFKNLFFSKKDKDRKEIEKSIKPTEVDNDVREILEKQVMENTTQTVKEAQNTKNNNTSIVNKEAKKIVKEQPTKISTTSDEPVISSNFLLDDILPSEKNY